MEPESYCSWLRCSPCTERLGTGVMNLFLERIAEQDTSKYSSSKENVRMTRNEEKKSGMSSARSVDRRTRSKSYIEIEIKRIEAWVYT